MAIRAGSTGSKGRHGGVPGRWPVVAGAVMIQACLGVIYAWPVFTLPLVEAGWSRTQTQVVFSTELATFALVMVLAGRWLATLGPRRLAMAGGLVVGAGYLVAGLHGGAWFPAVLGGVGLLGGAGIGLGYVVPIAVGMRWFPDRKGMITGVAVAGFGFGATLWVKLADDWGGLLVRHGLGVTFPVIGVAIAAVVALGSTWMIFPPGTPRPRARASQPRTTEYSVRGMLRTRAYWLLTLSFALGSSAGLMAVGLLKLFPTEALTAAGCAGAAAIAGNACAFCFPVGNGLGRLAWGAVSDRLGRPRTIAAMMALQAATMFAFPHMACMPAALYLGAALVGFNFGGNFALFPTATADFFGAASVGRNYGWVYLAYALGGILGPVMGGWLGDTGSFPVAFTICGVLCILASVMAASLQPPAGPHRPRRAAGA